MGIAREHIVELIGIGNFFIKKLPIHDQPIPLFGDIELVAEFDGDLVSR